MCGNAHGYDEWGLESTNLAIFLKATPLIKDINCGGQSKYRQSILTDKPPFSHRCCCVLPYLLFSFSSSPISTDDY